jgi:uncharacterized damage-inducible protein DinB
MNVAEEAIRTWESFRAGTIAELELIPDDKWDYRPAEGARTVRALARHIAQAGAGFTEELLREGGSFARLFDPKFREELAAKLPTANTKAEIIEMLRTLGADSMRRLRDAGPALVTKTMSAFGGEQSRLTGLWFAVSHEQYHRGQIASYVRQLGITPALTRQFEARSARK